MTRIAIVKRLQAIELIAAQRAQAQAPNADSLAEWATEQAAAGDPSGLIVRAASELSEKRYTVQGLWPQNN